VLSAVGVSVASGSDTAGVLVASGAGITATSGVCVTAGVLTISVGSACFVTHPAKISIIAAQSIRFIAFPPCHVFFYISIA
jgi:hypothetical protein